MKRNTVILIILFIFTACNGIYNLKPGTPTNVAAAGDVAGTKPIIIISWDSMANAAVYYIYRSASSAGPYDFYSQTAATEFIDNDIAWDTEYYYRVSSGNAAGTYESEMSAYVMGISGI